MDMPQEIEVWYVIPAIRRELTKALLGKGLTQKKIAALLEVTEPAISQYLKSKRAKQVVFDKKIIAEINKAADGIIKSPVCVMMEIQKLCLLVKRCGLLCKLHLKLGKAPRKCEACLK